MEQKVQVHGCHLLERKLSDDADILWAWTYPGIDEKERSVYLRKASILFQNRTRHFYYFRFSNLWVYIYFSEVYSPEELLQAKEVALILSSKDFNPSRYQTLGAFLIKSYNNSRSPIEVLGLFLSVLTKGECITSENGAYYLDEFVSPSPRDNSQIRNIIGRFGLETILIYTALLLKRRIVLYHHDAEELVTFVTSLPAFLPHREMWNLLYPWVDCYPEELLPFQESKVHIIGCTNSNMENLVDLYDLYVNIPASEIMIAPHSKEVMTMTKVHKDIALFMVQLTQKQGLSEGDVISSISQKTKELILNARTTIGSNKDSMDDLLKKMDFSSPLESFMFNLVQAEDLIATA